MPPPARCAGEAVRTMNTAIRHAPASVAPRPPAAARPSVAQALADLRHESLAQRRLVETIAASPRQLAQRRTLAGFGAAPVQAVFDHALVDGLEPARQGLGVADDELDAIDLQRAIYVSLTPQPDDPAVMPVLERIVDFATQADALAIRARELINRDNTIPEAQIPPNDLPRYQQLATLRRAIDGVKRSAGNELKRVRKLVAKAEYENVVEPETKAALMRGDARHLMIAPRPGTDVALGAGTMHAEDIPVRERLKLALPANQREVVDTFRFTGQAQGVLDVLVVGGGHGGVQALFEQDPHWQNGNFGDAYWAQEVVGPMARAGVRAHLIVLDACLTASKIGMFRTLLAADGKIVCTMYSTNTKVMTPSLWSAIHALGADRATSRERTEALVMGRVRELAGASEQNLAQFLSRVRDGSDSQVQTLVGQHPGSDTGVSAIRYLPRIHALVKALVEAQAPDVTAFGEALIDQVVTATPAPDAAESGLALRLIELAANDPVPFAAMSAAVSARLSAATGLPDGDLDALAKALRDEPARVAASTPGLRVPTQYAIYQNSNRELHFDALLDDAPAKERVVESTGADSRAEMRQLRQALQRLNDLTLSPQRDFLRS